MFPKQDFFVPFLLISHFLFFYKEQGAGLSFDISVNGSAVYQLVVAGGRGSVTVYV